MVGSRVCGQRDLLKAVSAPAVASRLQTGAQTQTNAPNSKKTCWVHQREIRGDKHRAKLIPATTNQTIRCIARRTPNFSSVKSNTVSCCVRAYSQSGAACILPGSKLRVTPKPGKSFDKTLQPGFQRSHASSCSLRAYSHSGVDATSAESKPERAGDWEGLQTMDGIEELFKERLVETTEGYFTCSRGKRLFTRTWTPTKERPKALVCLLHGFGSNISWLAQKTALLFTDAGFAVAAIDAQGFGRSDGLDGYIEDFDHLVSDAREFFQTVRKSDRYRSLPAFLYGESMGGASALLISLQEPGEWTGAVLSAPMVKILDKYRPPWIVEQLGLLLVHVIPTWPIVPVRNRIDNSFRDPAKCELAKKDPFVYTKKPRLKTGQELLRVTMELQQRLPEITIPFLVLHGSADSVTDIEVSQALYDQASSSDKTMNRYRDGYHALLQGEPEEQRQRIADDIITWFNKRVEAYTNADGRAALRDAEVVDKVLEEA